MVSLRHARLAALPAMLLVGLTGCSLLVSSGSAAPVSGIAACALGKTWSLDLKNLADQVLANLKKNGVAATTVDTTGSQNFAWASDGVVKMTSDYTLTINATPAAGQVLVVTQTHKGPATGKAYINASVAIPRNWDGTGFTVATKSVLNGAPVDPPPFAVPPTDFDDSVGVELTCSGDTLTTHARGSVITQSWTKSK